MTRDDAVASSGVSDGDKEKWLPLRPSDIVTYAFPSDIGLYIPAVCIPRVPAKVSSNQPSSMSSAFRIERCTAEDMPELGAVMTAAFETDAIMQYFHPGTPAQVILDKNIDGFHKAFVKPGRVHEKCVEIATGKIVALSRWVFPHHYTDEQKANNEDKAIYNWEEPAGTNLDITREFFEKMFAGRNKYINHEDMYFLDLLAVHPDYQRKGLGALLLESVTPIADKENRKIYLEASKKGHDLYLKHGWKQIDGMSIDTAPYGGPGIERLEFFMRDPKPVKES